MVACLDYEGKFSILGDLLGNINPLLRHNKEALYSHSFNQLIRKFNYTYNSELQLHKFLFMTFRGSMIELTFKSLNEAPKFEIQTPSKYTSILRSLALKGSIKLYLSEESNEDEESNDEFKEVKFWEIDHDLNSQGCIRP
jgi:hypothetical protein